MEADDSGLTRRELLWTTAAALLLAACGADGQTAARDGGAAADAGSTLLDATPGCDEHETEDNIEGPYYRPGAPSNANLSQGQTGTRLALSGQVFSRTCVPLAGAVIDLWQANDAGAYDAVGYVFRGKVTCDAAGAYAFDTIIPGRYLNGNLYRPAHIHVKVSAPGFVLLTTQLYFAGDPFNGPDAWIKPSLIMTPTDVTDGKAARFDFVLHAV